MPILLLPFYLLVSSVDRCGWAVVWRRSIDRALLHLSLKGTARSRVSTISPVTATRSHAHDVVVGHGIMTPVAGSGDPPPQPSTPTWGSSAQALSPTLSFSSSSRRRPPGFGLLTSCCPAPPISSLTLPYLGCSWLEGLQLLPPPPPPLDLFFSNSCRFCR